MSEVEMLPAVKPESLLPLLSEADRLRLSEAMQELLAHGSILGLEAGQSALYHWCRQNESLLREVAALVGLEVHSQHDERLVQALPVSSTLQLRLRQDATVVWMALWYAADVAWRDEGSPQAMITVGDLNSLLKDTLLPDVAMHPSPGRMKEILRQAARYNLVQLNLTEPFVESGIEILPVIRRVVPFQDIADWTETATRFQKEGKPADVSSTEAEAAIEEEDS